MMRCNHCENAPCVEICPTQALFTRPDGIVDFDNRRCIACKSCMQACPYDALYIDPETHTAAKCNYCAHRVEIGLEPACVNVCPTQAIISGDLDDPQSKIANLVAQQPVTVRKPEKGTRPNLFYIEGDEASLTPGEAGQENAYHWSTQTRGVGHHASRSDLRTNPFADILGEASAALDSIKERLKEDTSATTVRAPKARRVYDAPSKGVLWGWEVAGYILTKAMAALGDKDELKQMEKYIPMGHMGEPEDIAYAMLFLASDQAKYITGQTIVVDGASTLPESPVVMEMLE